jgi:hypothetical protein
MDDAEVSFTHILNPFKAGVGSVNEVASRLTWRTLRVAHANAIRLGQTVDCCAVILPGDEDAIEGPASRFAYLSRTIQDIVTLTPPRPFPLISDILSAGAMDSKNTHIIFSNMDIAVQPDFYVALNNICCHIVGRDVPFTVPRINIDAALVNGDLSDMYKASGPLGVGFDCFVIPCGLIRQLDLGTCCIGAPHFDQMLLIALDVLSGYKVRRLYDQRLTFHLGNDIAWTSMLDYIEHNLAESMAAIERIKSKNAIVKGSVFDEIDTRHFQRNSTLSSRLLRKIRRVPGLSPLISALKRALGRQY